MHRLVVMLIVASVVSVLMASVGAGAGLSVS